MKINYITTLIMVIIMMVTLVSCEKTNCVTSYVEHDYGFEIVYPTTDVYESWGSTSYVELNFNSDIPDFVLYTINGINYIDNDDNLEYFEYIVPDGYRSYDIVVTVPEYSDTVQVQCIP